MVARPNSTRPRRGLRFAAWAVLGAVALAVLVAIPNVGTATVVHPTLYTAPFHGTHHFASTVQKVGCGATASLVVPPEFNLTTGIGRSYGKSAVTACGPPGSYDLGYTEETTGFDSFAVVVHAPAPTNFSLLGHFNISWNLSATPMSPAGGPFAWAAAHFTFIGQMYDLTTASAGAGFTLVDTLPTTNSSTTGNESGYYAFPVGFSAYSPNLTVAGHHYIFQFLLEAWEWSYAPAGSGTVASARLNLATGGHLVKLVHWTLG